MGGEKRRKKYRYIYQTPSTRGKKNKKTKNKARHQQGRKKNKKKHYETPPTKREKQNERKNKSHQKGKKQKLRKQNETQHGQGGKKKKKHHPSGHSACGNVRFRTAPLPYGSLPVRKRTLPHGPPSVRVPPRTALYPPEVPKTEKF